MEEESKKLEVATFRFGMISEFVTNLKLTYGEREKLLKEKSTRSYKIPYSNRTTISRSTIITWVNDYKKAGLKINGLYPKIRRDKGLYKTLDSTVRMGIREVKKEFPSLTVPSIIKKMRQKKIIPADRIINHRSVYSFLAKEDLKKVNDSAQDRRRYEASAPNESWQSDVMHGPQMLMNGINKKSYLCAILDDHSRMIMHAEFYDGETLDNLKDCLKKAIEKRGLPQKFYVDNGACYRALNLEQITACLGIALQHARPYMPQGKGKIERWFRNVRDNFLPFSGGISDVSILNERLADWVEGYNNREHSTIKVTPCFRYKKNLACVRPAPPSLLDYFRHIDTRLVKSDRTFQLNSKIYEAPVNLIGKKIEVRYHQDESPEVEIFFNNISFGIALIVDSQLNGRIGRSYKNNKSHKTEEKEILKSSIKISSGKLFGGVK